MDKISWCFFIFLMVEVSLGTEFATEFTPEPTTEFAPDSSETENTSIQGLLESSEATNGNNTEQSNELFNVYLVQKADGSRELCFPLNFTDSFSTLADQYMVKNNLPVNNKPYHSRSKRTTAAFRKLLKLKRKVINTLLLIL